MLRACSGSRESAQCTHDFHHSCKTVQTTLMRVRSIAAPSMQNSGVSAAACRGWQQATQHSRGQQLRGVDSRRKLPRSTLRASLPAAGQSAVLCTDPTISSLTVLDTLGQTSNGLSRQAACSLCGFSSRLILSAEAAAAPAAVPPSPGQGSAACCMGDYSSGRPGSHAQIVLMLLASASAAASYDRERQSWVPPKDHHASACCSSIPEISSHILLIHSCHSLAPDLELQGHQSCT